MSRWWRACTWTLKQILKLFLRYRIVRLASGEVAGHNKTGTGISFDTASYAPKVYPFHLGYLRPRETQGRQGQGRAFVDIIARVIQPGRIEPKGVVASVQSGDTFFSSCYLYDCCYYGCVQKVLLRSRGCGLGSPLQGTSQDTNACYAATMQFQLLAFEGALMTKDGVLDKE